MASPFNIISNSASPPVPPPSAHPRPDWLRVKFFGGERYQDLKRIIRTLDLHTVCESARCPNMGECWEHGSAKFMILGDICTRACGFCAVPSGKPVGPPDEEEPFRVAEAVARMGLRYAVVTSVNRDDQPDGGAHIFARTIEEIHEVLATLQDLAAQGTDILTLGQYLQPTRDHLPIVRYVHPDEFAEFKVRGEAMGFKHVEAGPLVRSSYHAFEQTKSANK